MSPASVARAHVSPAEALFLAIINYSAAFSVIGLFALNVNRLCMAIAQIGLCGLVIGTLVSDCCWAGLHRDGVFRSTKS